MALVTITPETGRPVTPQQAAYLAGVPADASGLQLLKEGAYEHWREVTVPIDAPAGTHTLVLNFQSEATQPFMELDWLRFEGAGIVGGAP